MNERSTDEESATRRRDWAQGSFFEINDDGCGETDRREECTGTAIVPQNDPAPIPDPTGQDLDFVALIIAGLAVATPCRSVLAQRDTGCDAALLQGGDEPTRIITTVGEQVFGVGKTGQQTSHTGVITRGSRGQQRMHRLACVVAHRMEL